MGMIHDSGYYRRQAERYRRLAVDHANAGSPEMARKLSLFVAELDATADRLDISIR